MRAPDPFLEIRYTSTGSSGDDHTLCAGFELAQWRTEQLAEHILEWLPEFALPYSELKRLAPENAVRMLKNAAQTIYRTHKYQNRGEFGELLLHIAIRQVYETIPAISKIYFKSSVNKTVEGFDAIHVVASSDEIELWIGETKFYSDIGQAIRDVTEELVLHMQRDYLRTEFLLISNKIDNTWPHADKLRSLLSKNTPLEEVFARTCIPILLTYESPIVHASTKVDTSYLKKIRSETKKHVTDLRNKIRSKMTTSGPQSFRIHVILIPLHTKTNLVNALDEKLRGLQ